MQLLGVLFIACAIHFTGVRTRKVSQAHPTSPWKTRSSEPLQALKSVAFPKSREEHRVEALPGAPAKFPEQYAGLIPVDRENGGALFYWFFKHDKGANVPLLFWVNGGPGCSSMYGALTEQGLYRVSDDGETVEINDHAWSNQANIVFVDQPVGVGYSPLQNRKNGPKEDQAYAAHFMTFLDAFYSLYPEFADTPMFLTGESHGGHYVPVFSTAVMQSGKRWAKNLQGLMLANPWTDPAIQFASYSDYLYGLGALQAEAKIHFDHAFANCMADQQCDEGVALLLRTTNTTHTKTGKGINVYDSREYKTQKEVDTQWPAPIVGAIKYLNKPAVRQALHVAEYIENAPFEFCKDDVFDNLIDTEYISTIGDLQLALDAGKRVLIFAGLHDIVCNHLGTQKLANEIAWAQQKKYQEAQSHLWIVHNEPAGYVKQHELLTHVVVVDSGHMVLYNRPDLGADLLARFLSSISFQDSTFALPIETEQPVCYNFVAAKSHPITWYWLVSICLFLGILLAMICLGRKCWLKKTPLNRKPIYHKLRPEYF